MGVFDGAGPWVANRAEPFRAGARRTIRGHLPAHRGTHRRSGRRRSGRRRSCGRGRTRSAGCGGLGPNRSRRTDRGDSSTRRRLRGSACGDGRCHLGRDRRSDHLRPARPSRLAGDDDARILRPRRAAHLAGDPPRLLRRRCPRAQGTRRGGRRDRAVEHAAVPHRHQIGARAASRLLRRAQARPRIPVERIAFGRDARPGRPAPGRGERPTR